MLFRSVSPWLTSSNLVSGSGAESSNFLIRYHEGQSQVYDDLVKLAKGCAVLAKGYVVLAGCAVLAKGYVALAGCAVLAKGYAALAGCAVLAKGLCRVS